MKYGKFLSKNGTIGVVAPSFGCSGYPYRDKYDNAVKKFKKEGFNINEVKHLFDLNIDNILKDDYKIKADELVKSYNDPNIDILWSVAGGEIECNTIDNIDFNSFKRNLLFS